MWKGLRAPRGLNLRGAPHFCVLPLGALLNSHSEDVRKILCVSVRGRGNVTILKYDRAFRFS